MLAIEYDVIDSFSASKDSGMIRLFGMKSNQSKTRRIFTKYVLDYY